LFIVQQQYKASEIKIDDQKDDDIAIDAQVNIEEDKLVDAEPEEKEEEVKDEEKPAEDQEEEKKSEKAEE
jgi:hypothetical protein